MRSTPACPGSGSWKSLSAGTKSIPRSLIQRLDQVLDHLLRVAEHHHGSLHVEERVVEPGVAHADPSCLELLRQLLDRMLRARDSEAVPGHDDHALGIGEEESCVLRRA